jgi:hypothetical protein
MRVACGQGARVLARDGRSPARGDAPRPHPTIAISRRNRKRLGCSYAQSNKLPLNHGSSLNVTRAALAMGRGEGSDLRDRDLSAACRWPR